MAPSGAARSTSPQGGMARSVGGRPWADIGRGLVAGGIVTLWYDVAGLTLFAGTDDAGVFARGGFDLG